jgi:hypothetical protein
MSNKGRPTKHVLSFEQQIWDNYNPYYQIKEHTDKELLTRKEQQELDRVSKAITKIADLAGYEITKHIATIISKKLLRNV